MKKTSLLFAFAAILFITSCAKENTEGAAPQEENLVPTTLTASSDATKTFVNEKTLEWQAGDDLAVYDVTGNVRQFEIDESSIDGKSASFTGKIAEGTTDVYAVYPYASGAASKSSDNLSVTLPVTQNIPAEKNVAQGALIAVGKGTSEGLSLHNAFAFIKVTVSYKDINSIVINGTNIAGTASINPETGEIVEVTDGKGTVTVTYGENAVFPTGDYYIALLPGTTEAGNFSVTVARKSEMSAMKTASKAVVLTRNSGQDMEKLDASLEWVFNISDKASLKTFLANATNYENGNKALVTADIDCGGETLTAATSFKGILDGQNHVIKNFTIKENKDRVGIFETIDGNAVIKNITFGAEGGGSKIILDRTGQSGGYCYAAPIAYVAGAASLDNVTSYCDVEVSSGTISQSRAGGITGMWNSTSSAGIKNCKNYGSVTNNATGQTSTSVNGLSGIVAQADKALKITDCENYGDVINHCPYTVNIGGILGRSGQVNTYTRCKNYGNVSNDAAIAGTNALIIGGIAAAVNASISDTKLDGCENNGKVENTGNATSLYMAGIAAHIAGHVFTNCVNSGELHNNAVTATTYIGGIAAYGQIAKPAFNTCTNTGTILNEAASTITAVNIGGIFGRAHQTATFSGCVNGESGSSTKGAIANNASASDICIGGIFGYDQACSSLNGQKNYGPVSMTGVTSNNPRIGGIAGYGNNNAITVINCENNGNVTVHLAKAKQSFVGGVLGDTPNHSTVMDFSGNVNHGSISFKLDTKNDDGFYYIGGVSATKATGLKYSNCTNTGDISFEGPAKMRIGGIAGYTNQKVDNASVNCNITAKCTDNNFSEVGGVVGYTAMVDMNNWNFEGTINTSASTAKVYTGGLLGKTNGSSKFNGCKFKGTLTGASGNNVPGLYVGGLQNTNFNITFGNTTACKVGTGCVVNENAITELTNANLVSQSSDNGTFVSTATMKAISIAD